MARRTGREARGRPRCIGESARQTARGTADRTGGPLMEGVVALFIPIISVAGFFAWMIAISPVGKAFAERLRNQARPGNDGERQELLQAVEALRHEVAELAERVDFTERLLAQGREGEAGKLHPGERRTGST